MDQDAPKPVNGTHSPGGPDEQHRLLMDCVTDYAIFFLDAHGRVASWNKGAEAILGYGEGEAVGQPLARFFTPEDAGRGEAERELEEARATGKASDDRWLVRKDGARIWVSGITTALRDEDGGLRGFAKVTRELTEGKRLEDQLRRLAAQLEEADRRRDEFLAMLAHELRGPLAPIVNSLHLLKLRGPADPVTEQARETIARQVQHLTGLVGDLLDLARVKQGKLDLDRGVVELAAVVARAVETCRPLVEARRHALHVELPPAPVHLEADAGRLTQVLINLLNNAAKYTDEGGQVWLSAAREDGQVVLRVRDTGVGIPPETLPRLFNLFAQAEGARRRARGGLGIGLALVKSLVEVHGGAVEAHSDGPGTGSTFTVRLPAAAPAAPAPAAPGEQTSCAGPGSRVLVVDDDADTADSLALLLRVWGHEVRVAYDGPGALASAHEFRPEVVLLDLRLPGGTTGHEVARSLREQVGLTGAVLVALTGLGQEVDRRHAVAAGFDDHLLKPVTPEVLQALLSRPRPTPL